MRQKTPAETYGPCMVVQTEREASALFDEIVQTFTSPSSAERLPRPMAERVVRQNIGFWAAHYSDATREKVERLFRCEHPFMGSVKRDGIPNYAAAFSCGLASGIALIGAQNAAARQALDVAIDQLVHYALQVAQECDRPQLRQLAEAVDSARIPAPPSETTTA